MLPETPLEPHHTNLRLRDLPKTQRNAVIFLFILAIAIVIFWLWLIKAQINRPFAAGDGSQKNSATSASSTDSISLLKTTDTDHDGLSDYDEIYVYKTSPYLADSDSDGIPDKKEVEQGTDPNCPQGQDCQATETAATSSNNNLLATTSSSTAETPNLDVTKVSTSSLQQALSGQADAATLRQMLISGGADKSELDKISDADLLKSYQEVLNKNSATNSAQ